MPETLDLVPVEDELDLQPVEEATPVVPPKFTFPTTAPSMPYSAPGPRGALAQEFQAVARPVGAALDVVGKAVKNVAAANAFINIGQPQLAAAQLGIKLPEQFQPEPESEQTPIEQGMKALPTAVRIPSEAAYGLVETTPRLAGVAGLQAVGVPAPLAMAGMFGVNKEGFSPRAAAIAAIIPFVGKYGGDIAAAVANKLGVDSTTALKLVQMAGATGATTGLLAADQAEQIRKLPPDQRKEATIEAVASNVGNLVLGLSGAVGLKPEEAPARLQKAVALVPKQISPTQLGWERLKENLSNLVGRPSGLPIVTRQPLTAPPTAHPPAPLPPTKREEEVAAVPEKPVEAQPEPPPAPEPSPTTSVEETPTEPGKTIAEQTPRPAQPEAPAVEATPEAPPTPSEKGGETSKLPPVPKSIPFGRIGDLQTRGDANLIVVKPGKGVMDDYLVKRYPSRKSLEVFLKNPGSWNALVKNEVEPNALIHPAFQKPKATPPTPPLPPGPGAKTVGEPPYKAIQQLTDQLEATAPGPAKESIPLKEKLADAWGQGKTAWEKAMGKMTAAKQSLKETARGVRTPTKMDRRVGELDWELQQSAAQSMKAGKALEKQMPNKAMREAVAIWIDAGGDENLIRNVLANLPDGTPKNVRSALETASRLPPESKQLAEQTRQYFGIRAQDGIQADVLHNSIEDYFTHVWRKVENMPDDVRAAFNNGKVDTFFRNAMQRKIPMLLNGILEGKVPELDPAKVIPLYNYSMDRAIASRKFIKELSDMTEKDGRPTLSPLGRQTKVGEPGMTAGESSALLIKPKARWEENGDYHQVDHPALRKWKWAGTDENGRTIMYQSDLVVHPDAYERISRMMDRGRLTPSKLTAGLLRLSTEVKGFKLGVLSAFHTVHVGSHALFHWTDPIKAGFTPIDWEAPETRFAVEKGHLKLAPNPSELAHFSEGLLSPGLVHKIPIIGAWSKQFSEWNFGTYIPQLKMATFQNAYARAKWMQDKGLAFKGLTDNEIAARTGDSINSAFGELNQLFQGKNGRAPEFQRLLRGIFLAPDFGEARLRFAEKAFTRYGHEERIALATMFGVFYTTARVANLVANGDPQWDPKRAFQVKVGDHWWSMRSVIGDAWRAVNDFGKFLYPRLNPVYTRPIMDLIVGRDVMSGKKLSTFDKLVKRPLEQIVPIHLGGLTRDDQKVWESFAGSMGLAAIRDTPEMDMKRMAGKWLSDNGHPPTAEYLPTDTPTYAKLRQAIAIGNERNARKIITALKQTHEDKKIMDAMERYVGHPFTGSNALEDAFVGGMNEANLKLYQRAKEQRQKTLEDFYRIWFSIPKAKE